MSAPNYAFDINQVWGSETEANSLGSTFAAHTNVVLGQNPPYALNDFAALYPKFLGPATVFTTVLTNGSNQAVIAGQATGLSEGQFVSSRKLPKGTIVTDVVVGDTDTAVTFSNNATANSAEEQITVYQAPLLPLAAITAYLNLAAASLVQKRWRDLWVLAMGWYIAHYCTMHLDTDGRPNQTAAQAVAAGAAAGIKVARQAGDVHSQYRTIHGWDSWGHWNLTKYGQMLIQNAQIIALGPMLIR